MTPSLTAAMLFHDAVYEAVAVARWATVLVGSVHAASAPEAAFVIVGEAIAAEPHWGRSATTMAAVAATTVARTVRLIVVCLSASAPMLWTGRCRECGPGRRNLDGPPVTDANGLGRRTAMVFGIFGRRTRCGRRARSRPIDRTAKDYEVEIVGGARRMASSICRGMRLAEVEVGTQLSDGRLPALHAESLARIRPDLTVFAGVALQAHSR